MNYQVDIIIIGDCLESRSVLRQIASAKPTIKIAFISREFKKITTHDFLNVEYIQDEVTLVDYRNRLFGCYLKSGTRIYGTHIIIATGLAYEPLLINGKPIPCVYNNLENLAKNTKSQPAIVVGDSNADVKFALSIAKKYKFVYLCRKNISLEGITEANKKKLDTTKNLTILPNASLAKVKITDGILQAVELDNYSAISCSTIFAKTKAKPETVFMPKNIIETDNNGYFKTTSNAQSLLVPKCFAIGTCAAKYNKKIKQNMIESILQDF